MGLNSTEFEAPYYLYYKLSGVKHELHINDFTSMFTYESKENMSKILESMLYIHDKERFDELKDLYQRTTDIVVLNQIAEKIVNTIFK